jgi:hypothetical protein
VGPNVVWFASLVARYETEKPTRQASAG